MIKVYILCAKVFIPYACSLTRSVFISHRWYIISSIGSNAQPPEPPLPLMDDDESLRLVRKKFKEVKKNTKRTTTSSSFKCEIPAGALSSPLNEKEKRVIEEKMEGDFLGKFEVRVPS